MNSSTPAQREIAARHALNEVYDPQPAICPPCNHDCAEGRQCPRTFATTKPGDLAPEREERPVAGTGLVIALAIVFVGVISGALLAAAFQGGWR